MKRSTHDAARALADALSGDDAATRQVVESLVRLERALQDDPTIHQVDRAGLAGAVQQVNDALTDCARARGLLIGSTDLALAIGRVGGASAA